VTVINEVQGLGGDKTALLNSGSLSIQTPVGHGDVFQVRFLQLQMADSSGRRSR